MPAISRRLRSLRHCARNSACQPGGGLCAAVQGPQKLNRAEAHPKFWLWALRNQISSLSNVRWPSNGPQSARCLKPFSLV